MEQCKICNCSFLFGEIYGRRCKLSRNKSHEEYVEEVKIKNPVIKVIGIYINAKTKITHKCKVCNKIWDSYPTNILSGCECPDCARIKIAEKHKKSHVVYEKEMREVNPNIEVIGEYVGALIKIVHKCKICNHEWEATPSNILNGCGCPKCCNINRGNEYRKTHEEYINEVKIKNPDIEVIGKYKGNKIKILHRCNVCNNEWNASPSNVLKTTRCPKCCNNRYKKTHEEYSEEVKIKNPNIKLLSKYTGVRNPIDCECLICNNKWTTNHPSILLGGSGCPECGNKKIGEKLKKTDDEYILELRTINQDIEAIDSYVRSGIKISHRCKLCGFEWEITPSDTLRGRGCPKCKSSIGEKNISKFLNEHNIKYEHEKTFDSLKGVRNGLLSYDFYLPNYNLLIEYQGEQHFRSIEYFGGEKAFIKQQEHDKRKRKYAKLHKINLLEIRYDEDVNPALDKYFNNINNSNNLNSESLETVMPTIAI